MFVSRKHKKVEQTRLETENRTGGARSIISRRRAEVRSTPREREGSAVAFHNSTACSHTERPGRVQQVARDYRQSAARTRTPSVWGAFVSHIAGRRRRQWLCAENTSRNHWRSWSESRLWDPQAIQRSTRVIGMNRRTTGQYGLRGVRVDEANHPGPPKSLSRRPRPLITPEMAVTQVDTHADRRHSS